MSKKGLHILAKNHLPNINGQPLESCEDCLVEKQYRESFQRLDDARRRKHINDLVHSDVCSTLKGPLVVHNTLLPALMITAKMYQEES